MFGALPCCAQTRAISSPKPPSHLMPASRIGQQMNDCNGSIAAGGGINLFGLFKAKWMLWCVTRVTAPPRHRHLIQLRGAHACAAFLPHTPGAHLHGTAHRHSAFAPALTTGQAGPQLRLHGLICYQTSRAAKSAVFGMCIPSRWPGSAAGR